LQNMRRRKIATRLMQEGLQILKDKSCDVACLNADLTKTAYKFYEKTGFRLINREISFEDIHGRTRYDTGTMFIPICSKETSAYALKPWRVRSRGAPAKTMLVVRWVRFELRTSGDVPARCHFSVFHKGFNLLPNPFSLMLLRLNNDKLNPLKYLGGSSRVLNLSTNRTHALNSLQAFEFRMC